MDKQTKHQPTVDILQAVIKKLREKGPNFLERQQMAVCLVTVGFPDVCKKLGVEWNTGIQKQFKEKLIKLQVDIGWLQKKTPAEFAPFLVHCSRGDVAKIKQFIKKTPKQQKQSLIQAVDSSKKSAIHLAAKQGFDVLVDYLIVQKFKVNPRDKELKTPLHYACIGNHANVASSLITNNADIFARDLKGQLPLHCAVRSGNSKIVKQLLQKSPRTIDYKDFVGKTALHYVVVASTQGQIDVIRILIENGVKLDQTDSDGRTALHYACQYGKVRCIPILLKNKCSLTIRDHNKKSPLDLASNQKVKKLIQTYSNQKLLVNRQQQKEYKRQYNDKLDKSMKDKNVSFTLKQSKIQETKAIKSNNPLLGGDVNQVSTWLRQKFFVLMKKLQQSGVKIRYHLKKPFIYTGSWMQDIQSIQQLYSVFGQLTGPQVAMRIFNILCPFEKKLPTGISTVDAVQGFFGQSWFNHPSIDTIKKPGKSQIKTKQQLQNKQKQLQQYKLANIGYQSQLQRAEARIYQLNDQMKQYKKIQDQVRKQRVKNAKQYSQILKLTNQIDDLKKQVSEYEAGHDVNTNLQQKIEELSKKNQQLLIEIDALKSYEAAARRKCGKIFLKAIHTPLQIDASTVNNLYDDDAIIHLYELLRNNPPNMVKRLQKANKNGKNQLTVFQFNYFLQQLGMLPQDIMSMNRIVGFVSGRKLLPIQQFKQILQNRPQNRVQWQRKLLQKIKSIIKHSNIGSISKLFQVLDKDGSHSLSIGQLKQGLQQYNIYINQNDINNLFSLIDIDRSGQINLEQLTTLLQNGVSSKRLLSAQEFEEQQRRKQQQQRSKQEQIQHRQEQEQRQRQEEKQRQQAMIKQKQQQKKRIKRQKQEQKNKKKKQKQEQQMQRLKREEEQNKKQQQEEHFQQHPEQRYSVTSSDLRDSKFNEAMKQDTSDAFNGTCKIQIPSLKDVLNQKQLIRAVIKIQFCGLDFVKIGDFSLRKWQIAVQFNLLNKKMSWKTPLQISVYANERQYDQQHFLGMVTVPFQTIYQKPNEWAINKNLPLQPHPQYNKQVTGKIAVQAKWVPKQPQQQQHQYIQQNNNKDQKNNYQLNPSKISFNPSQKNVQNQDNENNQNQQQEQQHYDQNQQQQQQQNHNDEDNNEYHEQNQYDNQNNENNEGNNQQNNDEQQNQQQQNNNDEQNYNENDEWQQQS